MLEVDPEWLDTFGSLGLSTNEVKILYFLYIQNQQEKADTISEKTGVPLTRTYEALELLISKKFVEKNDGRPRNYQATNPQIAIQTLIKEEEEALQEKLSNKKKVAGESIRLAQEVYISNHTQIEPDELLEQFSSLREAENQTIEMIQDAEKEILIFSHVFQWYKNIKDHLTEAVNRGCNVKVLMQMENLDKNTQNEIDPINITELENLGIQVKNIPVAEIMTRGTLVDRKYVVFVIWVDPEEKKERRIYRPQFSSNPGIVDVFFGYFNYLWG